MSRCMPLEFGDLKTIVETKPTPMPCVICLTDQLQKKATSHRHLFKIMPIQ